MSHILPRLVIQIVESERFDVLEAYLHSTSIHKNHTCDLVKEDVRRIVEVNNLREFETNLKNYDGGSEKIKEFVKFFCPDPEPMDLDP